jgi:hypothetical protein
MATFLSRTGLRPFVHKDKGKAAPRLPNTAEFQALLLVMQEANLDLLGRFYGGAELYYEKSVTQKIVLDVGKRAISAAGKLPGPPAPAWLKSFTAMLAQKVLKEEAAYVIDNVAAKAVEAAADQLKDLIMDSGPQAVPIVGLLKTGWDALSKDADAIDKIIRTACARRHAVKVVPGSPRAAADAVTKLMARKAVLTTTSGASSTAAFGVGVAAEVGSLGAAVGTAELATAAFQAAVDLIVWLVEIVIDIMDFERGKNLLADLPAIVNPDQEKIEQLVNHCPVLGCYMLATPIFPTSAFVWLTAKDGYISSVDEIERLAISHVNPLRLEASWLIRKASFKMRNPENAAADQKIVSALSLADQKPELERLKNIRAATKDAGKRSKQLDRNIFAKALDRATQGAGKEMEGYGVLASGGMGAHTYKRHEGALHGLSEKITKYKKSTMTAITNTRAGKYLQSVGAFDEDD